MMTTSSSLKKSSDGKWSGSLSFSLSSELDTPKNSTPGENGAEKRREIPDMIEEYFTELGVDDEVSNIDDINDRTYVNKRNRRRLL